MSDLPQKLRLRMEAREREGTLRELSAPGTGVDFCSNDYLGFAREAGREQKTPAQPMSAGSGGSRLISGNHPLYGALEQRLCEFHESGAALVYNSGYDANLGLLGAVPQRTDFVFYDERVHASIRDGLTLSRARCYSFAHNSIHALEERAHKVLGSEVPEGSEVYVVTETVFSMEGDRPDLSALASFCSEHGFRLILDEAHATGVVGPQGRGAVAEAGLGDEVFARLVTFGKALGRHGAAILCSTPLRDYLLNFSRSLIYTTALPPSVLGEILEAYDRMAGPEGEERRIRLAENIARFRQEAGDLGLSARFLPSEGPIQSWLSGDGIKARQQAAGLQQRGYQVKPILYPTVPRGMECLRFCLHSFNTSEEIRGVLSILAADPKTEADG